MRILILLFLLVISQENLFAQTKDAWIRINQLGYATNGVKVPILCSKQPFAVKNFVVIDMASGAKVFTGTTGKSFGAYGPFRDTYRLDFSALKKPGRYFIVAGGVTSPPFEVGENV